MIYGVFLIYLFSLLKNLQVVQRRHTVAVCGTMLQGATLMPEGHGLCNGCVIQQDNAIIHYA